MVSQYLVSGGEAPVLASKTLVLRAIAGVGRRGGVGVEEGGGDGNSISTPLRLRSAQLSLHLGYELTRLFSFLGSPSAKKNDKDLGEELVDRFKCLAVAFLGELKIVPHVMVGDALVNLTKISVTHNTMQSLCVGWGRV